MWKVEKGFYFLPNNLDENEAAIVDVLMDFVNQGRFFGLSFREIENFLRDENHIRAFPENLISPKLVGGWIRDLVWVYYSCNVPQKYYSGDFAQLDLIHKIKATCELMGALDFKGVKVELVEVDDLEFVFKVEAGQLVEELSLDGFTSFWQNYLRKYFKSRDLTVLIEKNL